MNNFRLETYTGTVLDSQKHTQSHVYSEGGGGYVGPNGGRVEAATVKSYNTTRHDIFYRLPDGREEHVYFPLDGIALRNGNVITLIAAFRGDSTSGHYVRLCNHDTGTVYNVLDDATWRAMTAPDSTDLASLKEIKTGYSFLIPLAIWLALCLITISGGLYLYKQLPGSRELITKICLYAIFSLPLFFIAALLMVHGKSKKRQAAKQDMNNRLADELNGKIAAAVATVG
ncbi:hypothetical protein [Hymenobacter nivis]|uniref:Uncharacterized protein n=1 Tax=Hymenobacter nivis TaxID=1850093 RepID=A0A2Z3GPM3_9BACT|nr:hypothetical protein [Hymenobacter nivis]AWM32935.1 hypothetical protein DDQ68_09175 [Hymenobacter nivis]